MLEFDILKLSDWFDSFRKDSQEQLSSLFSGLSVRIYFVAATSLNLASWIWCYIIDSRTINEGRELTALHYSVDFGVNLIGSVTKIYQMPLFGLLVLVINFSILLSLSKRGKNAFLLHCLLLSTVIVNLFILLSVFSVYLVNFKA